MIPKIENNIMPPSIKEANFECLSSHNWT
jgi:hypothetical protein